MKKTYKILNKENQDEIGFDLDMLPKKIEDKNISEYIYKNKDGTWRYDRFKETYFTSAFIPYRFKNYWYFPFDGYSVKLIEPPTKFEGTWEESLFKIIR